VRASAVASLGVPAAFVLVGLGACASSAGPGSFGSPGGVDAGGGADGAAGTQPAHEGGVSDSGANDASAVEAHDATTGAIDGAKPPSDAAVVTPDESVWLVPMNAARTMVGEAPLVWNPIAAKVAQDYASLCNYEHNENSTTDYESLGGGDGGLGENIAAGEPTESPTDAVASWVDEIANYDHASNTCALLHECGHYTQIVWSTTTAVGCAHVSCTVNSPFSGGGGWDFSVCDFSPPGNYVGEAPY
jgi:pathogenesis-related protein 1